MGKFIYNNAKNVSIGHTRYELNYSYHLQVFFKNDVNFYSRSCFANELAKKLSKLIDIYQQNLLHAQEFQKRAYDKSVKPQNYASGEKIWLNSKYIKTKQNWKLEIKIFDLFQILHLFGKQAYKLDFPIK